MAIIESRRLVPATPGLCQLATRNEEPSTRIIAFLECQFQELQCAATISHGGEAPVEHRLPDLRLTKKSRVRGVIQDLVKAGTALHCRQMHMAVPEAG